jgi:outer membrane protein OmpA-like peptidoglycan-associated protein
VGSDVANLRLSQARADSVVRAISDRGVNSNRLDAVGFGEMRPIDANETDDGRAANRRVEFIIVDQE